MPITGNPVAQISPTKPLNPRHVVGGTPNRQFTTQ